MAYFDFSNNGTTWVTNLPEPATQEIDYEDLDLDSYRSVVNGNIIRRVVGYKWIKVGFGYNFLTTTQANALENVLKQANDIYIRIYTPDNANSKSVYRGYVSKVRFNLVVTPSGRGFTASFNFIEGKR